ncbi:MAG TPA: hypothetical protein DCO79_01795 [Spirochaeta sp.]|nr:hypothetical protein [Spirochaeta sp.]
MKIPKLPFSFPQLRERLSETFSFSRREIIITAAVIVSAAVAAVIIIAVVSSAGRGTSGESDETAELYSFEDSAVSGGDLPFLSDFIIYEDKLQESFTGVILSREPVKQWTDEQVEEYWIEPESIAAEHLEQETEKIIRDIFADVP